MKYFLMLVLLTASLGASAQFYDKPSYMALEAGAAFPMGGYFSQSQKTGASTGAKLIMPLSEESDLLLVVNAMVFPGKMIPAENSKLKNAGYLNILSGMIGYRYSFTPTDVLYDDRPVNTVYIEPKVGVSFIRSKGNALVYAPAIGYLVGGVWDISLRYQATSSQNFFDKSAVLSLALGYNFSF